jgi:acyl-CoA synthetase (AMP-forming)/AMP-acid ligase II
MSTITVQQNQVLERILTLEIVRVTDETRLDVRPAAFARDHHDDRTVELQPALDHAALMIYTSGTTGRPKGVMLDHANIESMTGMLLAQDIFRADDKALLILPLFHVNAIMASVVVPLSVGGSSYIAERFDAQSFWSLVEQERPAFFSAVPAIYLFLTNLPDDVHPDVSSLRLAFCGAAPMPADAIRAFESRYGIPVLEGYGLSESTVALTFNPIDDRRPGTVGKPLGGLELRVVDTDGGPLPVGHDGEVIARGPNIMRGYLNKPAQTAAALQDGWLWTGDVGHFDDDGYLVLVDRKKDLIIRGGENISPSEVEAVLQTHPSVAQAAVVGRPDPVMGEEPVAFVVPTPGATINEADVIAHCRAVLARFKVPRAIHAVDTLPRNAVGKVTKDDLRRRLVSVS